MITRHLTSFGIYICPKIIHPSKAFALLILSFGLQCLLDNAHHSLYHKTRESAREEETDCVCRNIMWECLMKPQVQIKSSECHSKANVEMIRNSESGILLCYKER